MVGVLSRPRSLEDMAQASANAFSAYHSLQIETIGRLFGSGITAKREAAAARSGADV